MKTCTPPKPSYLARVGRFVLGLAAGSLLAQTGWADSITLSPTADTRMISADANKNFGADNMMGIYMGRDRSLLQFDLSGIPAGQFIASATLSVYAHTEWGSNPAADPIEVYRVVTPWTELGVTWNSADGTTPWTAAGGDAVGTTQAPLANPFSVSTQSPGEGQPITWEVGSLVSEWYAGTTPNLGLLLVLGGAHSAGMHLWTKEQADPALHPTLTVQYSTSAVAPAITAQPQSRFAVIGNRVTFTATASGTAPVFYQWFKDGATLLSDQTNSVLTFPYVQLADAGSYSMTASNEAGVVASDSAGLMVFVADVAKGAAATQSSTDNGGVASRAVDGNTDGNWGSGSVTHTGNTPQDNEWWEVNLGTPTVIDRVQLWFRSDCCQVRNEDVRIFIYDTTNTATRQILWTQDVGPNPGATKGFDVIPSVLGQVVRVEHPPGIVQILSLAEVQVFTGDHVVAGPVAQSVSVQGGRSLGLVVHFDLALDTFSATNLSNYVLAHGGPPTAAALQADGKSVLLSGINLNIGDSFSLDVSGINSVAGHPMSAPQTLTGTVGFYTVDWALS